MSYDNVNSNKMNKIFQRFIVALSEIQSISDKAVRGSLLLGLPRQVELTLKRNLIRADDFQVDLLHIVEFAHRHGHMQLVFENALQRVDLTIYGQELLKQAYATYRAKITKFDVFLAHNSADKSVVQVLCDKLIERGFSVWFDKDNILAGDDIDIEVINGLSQVPAIAFVIGEHKLGKYQKNYELWLSRILKLQTNTRLIPILLPGTSTLPRDTALASLRPLRYLKFEKRIDEEDKIEELVASIQKAKREKI